MAAYTFDCCCTGVMLFFAASSTFTEKCQQGNINAEKKNGNDLEGFLGGECEDFSTRHIHTWIAAIGCELSREMGFEKLKMFSQAAHSARL